jgi:esterase/lipase
MNDLISQNPEMEQLIEAVFQIKDQLQGDYYEEGDIQNITECIQKFTEVYDAQTETMNEHLEKITKVLADISAQIYNLQ